MQFSESRKESVNQLIVDLNLEKDIEPVGSGIYLSYPDFFYKLLLNKEVDFKEKNQTTFCLASFVMFKFLIQTDHLIDNQNEISVHGLQQPLYSYNLSMRLLNQLFDLNSGFWKNLSVRQEQFLSGVYHEKVEVTDIFKIEHYNSKLDNYYYEDYFKKKCAFSSLALDGIYHLNEKKCALTIFEMAHSINDAFNFAFCVLDDVEDFRKDIGKSQINIAHHFQIEKNNRKVENINQFLSDSIDDFYTKGTAIELIDMAKEKLNYCLNELDKFSYSEDLKLLIEIKLTDVNNKYSIISEYSN